jgi:hypothetical protein
MLGHQVQGEDGHQERERERESTDAITLAVLDASADRAIENRKARAVRLRTGTCQTS